MDFIDQVKIFVKAGDGGRGCLSFRREKFVPRGGPNGGDGGNGGSVVIIADPRMTTLLDLKYQKHYQGKRGEHGLGSNMHGANSPDLIISVPLGTIIKELDTGRVIKDLLEPGDSVVVAKGGRGGRGNARFVSSTNRAPRIAEDGEEGEEHWLELDLKLIADVALVGYPNAGKSTFISRISAAHPKVADYPFTTLVPHLGVVKLPDFTSFVVADIPGLIEGAHRGIGLGDRFLRHVERTKLLLHLIDISFMGGDTKEAFEAINRELLLFNSNLAEKPQIVVATKMDSRDEEKFDALKQVCQKQNLPLFPVSSHTGEGIDSLLLFIGKKLQEIKKSDERA